VDVSVRSLPAEPVDGLIRRQVAGDGGLRDPQWIHQAIEAARFFEAAGGLSSADETLRLEWALSSCCRGDNRP
jgi:hypothetical protein